MSEDNDNGSSPPNSGSEGGADKQVLLRERLHKLQGLVLVHALPHVRAAVRKELAGIQGDRIDEIAEDMRQEMLAMGESPEDVESAVIAARDSLEQLGRGDPGPTEEIVGMALLECAPRVVASWANTLGYYASRGSGIAWLRTSMLGDDMLPLNDKECREAFTQDFAENSPIDGEGARAILRDIRASLPTGKALPDDMVVALDLAWGITVVP